MPWIKVIRETESEGELKETYAKMREVNNSFDGSFTDTLVQENRPVGPPTLSSLNPKAMLLEQTCSDFEMLIECWQVTRRGFISAKLINHLNTFLIQFVVIADPPLPLSLYSQP